MDVKSKYNKIVVVFSSHLSDEENHNFNDHIDSTIGSIHREIVCFENFNEYSLSELYNKALREYAASNTIFVFCHNDILFKTKNWGRLLLDKFNNTDYDILGVAGSTYLANNGVWWADKTKMVGIVDHTDGFNEWSSQYSFERKGKIIPTITIDGLFMAVKPDNLEHDFDEDFKGFHFYDLGFCFPNYLDYCNIGVTTDIRILHKSVGETDDKWEENRKQFVEKYKDELPIKHVNEDKLRVLICCQFFKNLTGSELSILELSKQLVKQNYDVTIISALVGDPLLSEAKKAGIKVYPITNIPGFRVQGNNIAYTRNELEFDILHLNHKPISEIVLQLFPNTPAVMHVRSEVIPGIEEPIKHPMIKKYISNRESITEFIKTFDIEEKNILLVDIPFDTNKFNTDYEETKNEKEVVLFVGTHDYLRKEMLFDLVEKTKENNQELWLIGANHEGYAIELEKHDHVKYLGIKENIEEYVKKCDYTAGILKGRTTIEGWLCGKPGWVYIVDKEGKVLSKELVDVPEDIDKHDSEVSTKKILDLYEQILFK